MYYPYDPNQQVMSLGPVSQMGGQSYMSQSQLLSQQRTAPPPQVQAIQPPPSSFYSGGAGQSNQNTGYYQQPGGPSLQQMGQPPATATTAAAAPVAATTVQSEHGRKISAEEWARPHVYESNTSYRTAGGFTVRQTGPFIVWSQSFSSWSRSISSPVHVWATGQYWS